MTFAPDTILPGQLDNRSSGNPYQALVLAVLEEATRTLSHEEYVWSFVWCCTHTKIDPAQFRRDFLRMVADGKGGSGKRRLVMGYHKKIQE